MYNWCQNTVQIKKLRYIYVDNPTFYKNVEANFNLFYENVNISNK